VRARFASLTSRLVVTAVALVAVVSVVIGLATTLAVRSYLTSRLDDDVRGALERAQHGPVVLPGSGSSSDPDHDDGPEELEERRGQGVGTLTAVWPAGSQPPIGDVITEGADRRHLSSAALAELDALPADGRAHHVDLPGVGSYRVAVVEDSGSKVAAGLPTDDVNAVVSTLVWWELLLTLLGVGAAAGAGLVVVRRQLRPLREVAQTAHTVAELPLASGEIDLTERVPGHLTDERTEVGQVGAALNTLLAHVESSLEARHRSEQQVRQFVADASHELRTPLATIAGYTELARRRPDDIGTVGTALGKVEEESGRMTALVEDLLLLARLDAGRPLEREPVDLTRLLLEAVSDARVVAPDHRWRLDLPEESVEVVGDERRLHQVVTNLLTNARKYTPAGTTVTVSARSTPGSGRFTVHDDGPGFPPDLVGHAFERFARADAARTRASATAGEPTSPGGAGLGLALVEAIVHAHGGRVSLSSHPGDTTLTVDLPRTQ
jgi:two-component system OmpR family sensor kinase